MLRALFVSAIIVYGVFQSFRGPFYGLLFYLWLAYFRPEYWLWSDFVSQLNLSFIVGVTVLVSTMLSGRKLRLGIGPCLMILFLGQSFISTMMSPAFAYAWPYWQDFAKSTTISLLIVTLVDDERQLRFIFLVIASSLGLEAVKQGWAQLLLNPGGINENAYPVLGDNNGVAVGMFMLVAVFVALARTAPGRKERLGHRFAAVGVLYRGISTFSRGGFLACGALGLHFLMRSKRKVPAIAGIAIVGLLIVPVLPDAFWERMDTISTAGEGADQGVMADDTSDAAIADASAAGRLHFWQVAVVMANEHPLTGIGHNAYNAVYNQYDTSGGDYGEARAVHSSWLAVLSELGYPGLLLFVLLVANALWVCRRARRLAKRDPRMQSLAFYAVGIEGALVAFAVGGSFVSFQYVEFLWHTFALSMVVDRLVAERFAALAAVPHAAPTLEPARARTGFAVPATRPVRV